jgi:uncharacterized membrane protein
VLAIVHWIGGVWVVTTIVLPRARRLPDSTAALAAFEGFERRFARQVRISILLAGLSGLYMLYSIHGWSRFAELSFWWLHLMVAVWVAFAVVVYALEPLFLHARFERLASGDIVRAFAFAHRLHAVALAVAAFAIIAGVLGADGALF